MSGAVAELAAAAARAYGRVERCHAKASYHLHRRTEWLEGARALRNPHVAARWEEWGRASASRAVAWSMVAQIQLELSRGDRAAALRCYRHAVMTRDNARIYRAAAERMV